MIALHKNHNLVWIDLEMTGLNPDHDVILEIATIITDSQLNIIAQGPTEIIHHDEAVLNMMNEWVSQQHTASGLLEKVRESTTGNDEAAGMTMTFIKEHCEPETALLAGNSVWADRAFLKKYMPEIMDYLHYRMVDVSTVKELIRRWYPNDPHVEFQKGEAHRALDDIKESIEELKHYRTYFFRK